MIMFSFGSMVVAHENNTKFWVCYHKGEDRSVRAKPGCGYPIYCSEITLNAGDCVVFSAECGHGGAAYPADQYPNGNSRTHVYLYGEDTARFKVQADDNIPGKTHSSIFPVSLYGAEWNLETVKDGRVEVSTHVDNPQPQVEKRKRVGKRSKK